MACAGLARAALLACSLLRFGGAATAPQKIYVSPTGSDDNSGRSPGEALASCRGAVRRLEALLSAAKGLQEGGAEVLFAGGTYALTADTACGKVSFRGTSAAPVIFRAADGQEVIFDGAAALDAAKLRPVTNETVRALLNPAAADAVRALPVKSTGWTGRKQQLQWGARPLTPSVWPNTGLGYTRRVYDEGAVYCPGRTKGPPPVCHICEGSETSTPEAPCGANMSLVESPQGDWERELHAGPGFGGSKVQLSGYLSADWFRESHTIVRVRRHGKETTLQFGESSHYGVCEAMEGPRPPKCGGSAAPGRFRVHGLLSEVDAPGEYFYDEAAQVIYLIPPEEETSGKLGYWASPGLASISNSSHVTFRDFTVTGTTEPAITIVGGENNTVGGCTVRSAAAGIALLGGRRNRVLGNDIYDVLGSHIRTASNPGEDLTHSRQELRETRNVVANNHLTQVWLSDVAWTIGAGGIGERFHNNLMHDSSSQLVNPGGPLSMWDHNEVFNTGYAEGDGGVFYGGASLVHGYGMHLRENFIHHSLDMPGLVGRHGIHLDDHFNAVSNCSGNVLYKAAGVGIQVHSGAGNNVTRNLIMNSGMGIATSAIEDVVRDLPSYDNGTLRRGDKMDYVYNAERSLGVSSYSVLFQTALAKRFPSFAKLLSQNSTQNGWASAANSLFAENVFVNNSQGEVCFEVAETRGGKKNVHTYHCSGSRRFAPLSNGTAFGLPISHYLDVHGSRSGDFAWFPGAERLEFVNSSLGFDTRRAGLYCDEWRRTIPNASAYRPFVKHAFDGLDAVAHHGYTPEAAERRSGVRTGRALVLNFTVPCPAKLQPRDCRGAWFAWGECQDEGHQVLRYTVEEAALAGGQECPWQDGHTATVRCGDSEPAPPPTQLHV